MRLLASPTMRGSLNRAAFPRLRVSFLRFFGSLAFFLELLGLLDLEDMPEISGRALESVLENTSAVV